MLVDPTFHRRGANPTQSILDMISGGRGRIRHAQGFYEVGHWNFPDEVAHPSFAEGFADYDAHHAALDSIGLEFEYGTCDTPEQFIARFSEKMAASLHGWVVSFCVVRKADQSDRGGWRWHKWGPYIGEKSPTMEYLYDEPEIDQATCFHVYRVKDTP